MSFYDDLKKQAMQQHRQNVQQAEDMEGNRYLAALQKAAGLGASQEFGQGLSQITNSLAGMGPLADSGAANSLRARLLSNVYARQRQTILKGYLDFLRNRQLGRYQIAAAKAGKPENNTSAAQDFASVAGAIIPG